MTTPTDPTEQQVIAARPDAPRDVMSRCLPDAAGATDDTADAVPVAAAASGWHRLGRGVAVILMIGWVIFILRPRPDVPHRELVVRFTAAINQLDQNDAIVMRAEYDHGPGTESALAYIATSRRGAGTRFEYPNGNLTFYDADGHRRGTYDAAADRVVQFDIEPDSSLPDAVRLNADATRVLRSMQFLAMQGEIEILHERVTIDGVICDRYEVPPVRGLPMLVEIEAGTTRVRRAIRPDESNTPPRRAIAHFSYPDPATLPIAWFDPGSIDAATVIILNHRLEAREAMMQRTSSLMMAVATYAAEWDGRIPPDLVTLAPYLNRPLEWYLAPDVALDGIPLTIESDLEALAVDGAPVLQELPPNTVLFSCQMPDGCVFGYADTRTVFVPE